MLLQTKRAKNDLMIQIQEKTIIEATEKGMDEFLKVFTDAYLEAIGGDITATTQSFTT